MSKEREVPPLDICKLLPDRLESYKDLSFLEQHAMFMGKAQILEMGLKNVLAREFGFELEAMEKWTLGRIARELKKAGVRPDFIGFLESVVDLRNYIAHELLANEALLRRMTGGESGRLEKRHLEKGIYELEQIILIFDWQEEHDAWT